MFRIRGRTKHSTYLAYSSQQWVPRFESGQHIYSIRELKAAKTACHTTYILRIYVTTRVPGTSKYDTSKFYTFERFSLVSQNPALEPGPSCLRATKKKQYKSRGRRCRKRSAPMPCPAQLVYRT